MTTNLRSHYHPRLDGGEDQRISPGAYSSPCPSRSFSVLLVLTVHVFTYRSSHSPSPIAYFIPLMGVSVPAYDSSNSQANRESSVSCLAPPRPANTVSSENDIDHGAVDRPSGVVAPRTHLHRRSHINLSSPGVFTSSAPAISDSSHGPAIARDPLLLMNTSCRSQFASLR